MTDSIDQTTLARYAAGQLSAAECERVEDWVGHDLGRRAYVESLRTIGETWADRKPADDFDSAAAWRQIRPRALAAAEGTNVRAMPRPPSERPRMWSQRSWIFTLSGASALAVISVLGYHWSKAVRSGADGSHVYATTAGQRATVRLLDGTEVTLAPETRIIVGQGYGRGNRTLSLNGEAVFSVVHDVQHPFAVKTAHALVRDVGTEFVVRAYAEESSEDVAVIAGAVDLRTQQSATGPWLLTPGDLALIGDSHAMVTHHVDLSVFTAWMQGRLAFNRTPLRDAIREVGRTFDVTVTLADSGLGKELVTGNFGGQGIDEILFELTTVIGARYERTGRHVVIRPGPTAVQSPTRSAPRPQTLAQKPTTSE